MPPQFLFSHAPERVVGTGRRGANTLCPSSDMPPVAPLLRLGHLADGTPALGQAEVLLSGFGVERFGGGALYTGSFHRGRWHGRGALTSKDPRGNPITHDGMWRDGLREGRGVETLSHQSSTCVGAWSKGSKHGAFRCLVNGSWRAEGWDHGVRTRARAVLRG